MTQSCQNSQQHCPTIAIGHSPPMPIRTVEDFDCIAQLMAAEDSPVTITVTLCGIRELAPFVLQALARFLAAYRASVVFRKSDGHTTSDPFEAVDAALDADTPSDVVIATLIEIASAYHAADDNREAALEVVQAGLRRRQIRVPRDLAARVRAAILRHRRAGTDQPRIAELLHRRMADLNLPIDPDLVLPRGWTYDEQRDALVRDEGALKGESTDALDGILFAREKSVDPATDLQRVEICWSRQGRLQSYWVDRQAVLTMRGAEKLAGLGLPVGSINSKLLVAYFLDFFRDNDFRLEQREAARRLGWKRVDGTHVFVLGDRVIAARDGNVSCVSMEDTDPAFRQIAAAFTAAGDRAQSLQLMREVSDIPAVWFSNISCLATVLLEPLRRQHYIVDVCGETSSGKTTVAIISASMWGRPTGTNDEPSVIQQWSVTPVYVERRAAWLGSLPFFLDDSSQVTNDKDVGKIIYDLANGRSKGRGTQQGIADQVQWKLVTFSTGEQSLTAFNENAGCRARTLTLRGSPFPGRDAEWRRRIENWREIASQNFGFLAAEFVQYVVDHQADWTVWQQRICELKSQLEPTFSRNAVAGRHLEYLALITLTAELVCDVFGLPAALRRPVDGVRELLLTEYNEADRPWEALEQLLDYIAVEPDLIAEEGRNLETPSIHNGRRTAQIGKYHRTNEDVHWSLPSLAIVKREFDKLMIEIGYRPDEILTAWKQRGWLHHDSGSRQKTVRIRGTKTAKTVCIKGETLRVLQQRRDQQAGVATAPLPAALPTANSTS